MQKIQFMPIANNLRLKLPQKNRLIEYKNEIFAVALGIICSFSTVFGSYAPFCVSYFASGIPDNTAIFKLLAIAASLVFSHGEKIKYIAPIIFYFGISLVIPLKKTSVRAILSSLLLFASGIILSYSDLFLLYDILLCVAEAFVAFVGVFIMDKAIPPIKEYHKRSIISQDEFVCISALFAIFSLAFVRIPPFFGIKISNILLILSSLVFVKNGEMGIGSSIGVICGAANGLNSFNLSASVGAFAFSSTIAGFFKNYGKLGVCLGFILANTVITIFLNSSAAILINPFEIIIASAVFLALPKKIFDISHTFSDKINSSNIIEEERALQFKTIIKTKISAMALSLDRLANMYFSSEKSSSDLERKDIISFFDLASKKVCADCTMRFNCWQNNCQATYRHMLKMLSLAELNGSILTKQLPEAFKNTCIHQEEFCTSFNNMYEIFKISKFWKGKITESKNAAALQIKDLSKIIKNTVNSTDIALDINTQNEIKAALSKRFLTPVFVWAIADEKSKEFEITVCIKENAEIKKLAEAVEEVLCKKVRIGSILNSNCDMLVKFYPAMKLAIESAEASIPKSGEEICGDTSASVPLSGGHMIAVSDGMGSGENASEMSISAIGLLKRFFEAGFDTGAAVNIINSALLLKSNSEIFATLDLCAIDLDKGLAHFIKVGGANSYIKRGKDVEKVEFSSLPAGILMNVDKKHCVKNVSRENIIIMLTDGVFDSFESEDELICAVKNADDKSIKDFTQAILKAALKKCNGLPNDDMTVVCARIY